jgi:uncharacterized hydrophobic protein (TIGR00271 family)
MNLRSPGILAALLGPGLKVPLQLKWATHLAKARGMDLLILHGVEDREERVAEVPLDEPPGKRATGIVREVMRIVEKSPDLRPGPRGRNDAVEDEESKEPQIVHMRFRQLHYTSLRALRRLVLAELGENKVSLFTEAREQLLDMRDTDYVSESRLFLRYIPCEVVLCQGLKEGNEISRVLTTVESGPDGKAAVRLGLDLAAQADRPFTALHVNPDVGPDTEQVGDRRLVRLLKKSLGMKLPAINRRVVVENQIYRGIRRVWDEGNHDLIVLGTPRSQIEGTIGAKLGKDVTAVFVCAASPFANPLKRFVEEGIQRFVPQIDRENRIALVERLQSSAAWNFDFVTLMVLSTTMAAIGLIQNSAAVVIGAMLVAPLMTPLLGLGLALVQGNTVLVRISLRSVMLGLCVSLLGGFLVGFFTPSLVEPTREMLARGGPGLLDLFVAFAAGLAAAYASSRPGLIAALPGVAIAAALVPPIATSGLALSLGDFPLAIGALLLFGINMVTIVLASMISLWMVGIRNLKKASSWIVAAGSVVIVAVVALGVFLTFQPKEYELTEQLPEGLVEAVQESLGADYQLEGLSVAYDELGLQLRVGVSGKTPAPEELATEVRTVASDHYDQPVRVRLLTRIAIDTKPEKKPSPSKKRKADKGE